ncbi:MAG: ester cyclase [Geminicoccaceae bacterium]
MSATAAARAYVDAWNARSSAAILASLTEGGTYQDPTTPGPLSGAALAAHVEALWQAFPDLAFDLVSLAETGGGGAAFEWRMHGTNTGSFRGLPPTGRRVDLPGADFIATEGGKVRSVTGYFDGGAVPRQLGLQILVQPQQAGPFSFGYSTQVQSGRRQPPGAISLTSLHALDDARIGEVRQLSRNAIPPMLGMPGFIGATTAGIGRRMVTISAWDDADASLQVMRPGTGHAEAMKPFFRGELASAGFTSVWVPHRVNSYWVRCDACGRMAKSEAGPTCGCGAALPETPPWW